MPAPLVIQSCSPHRQHGWIGSCLTSVQRWAKSEGHEYCFIGDEIFALVPAWYMAKVSNKLPVATDYARLTLARQALAEGYSEVIWCDADLLVLDPSMTFDFDGTCAFGQEVWVQQKEGRLRARRNVHNAVCVFRRGCPVLPFLIHTVESLMRRVDPAHVAPQMCGPKLLQALHPLCDFAVLPEVGALSPLVVADLCGQGSGKALALMLRQSEVLPEAVNLCASLLAPADAGSLIHTLQTQGLAQH